MQTMVSESPKFHRCLSVSVGEGVHVGEDEVTGFGDARKDVFVNHVLGCLFSGVNRLMQTRSEGG